MEIAERLGVDESSVRRGLRRARQLAPLRSLHDTGDFLDTPIRHNGAIAVSADWHIPLVDYEYASRFLQHCYELDIRTLAIAGDFFNHDALSSFDYKQASADLTTELDEANSIMRSLTQLFDKIIFVWGNHDARVHKALGYKLSFIHSMKAMLHEIPADLLDKIEFSNLDHFWVDSPDGEPTYICHPKNYSATPLANARKMAAKMQANVITAHSHHAAMGFDVSGKYVCVEAGGFFDASRTAYLQRSTNFQTWCQGYSLIDADGHISMYTPRWSART